MCASNKHQAPVIAFKLPVNLADVTRNSHLSYSKCSRISWLNKQVLCKTKVRGESNRWTLKLCVIGGGRSRPGYPWMHTWENIDSWNITDDVDSSSPVDVHDEDYTWCKTSPVYDNENKISENKYVCLEDTYVFGCTGNCWSEHTALFVPEYF